MEVLPELYDIFQGEVASVTEYGAFIKIPGTRKQGLVHKSHMSACRVDKPSELVDVGEKVWVKLIGKEKTDDKLKLSLSMKVVNQGTGKDLDPNNVALDQDARKKRSFKDYTSQKITLEAVLNTVCKKCGCPGHFAKECFMQPGGTKYTLIPEEDEEIPQEAEKKTHQSENSAKKRKKEKKKKKKHKSKTSSESENSNTGDSDDDQPAKKKAKRTEKADTSKKRKKKKHHRKKHKE
ncbi:zinc finger CCHC domain-containing protein 17 [Hemicordylus capensis]|uniref:zinc finger CCHC domain-containing protein 17 n=1 Tax=Hemicordylus capensis TaxID=884348 RepID=UPI0023043C72|nr:zinc finger CCHC domain-containing protein 17 [Hemicordylus capensis]XP_053123252.1 zinc finger CCHC domain-containing protein 17 [Hemicordylus capensis]XP_053123253.1 zinc finger CCHC domain-containing protein 17 [Hemicordylus capensis]XP_053123254.1 zinc finger CCHC domain-containing protein 17 [Hemicordylus capensis]